MQSPRRAPLSNGASPPQSRPLIRLVVALAGFVIALDQLTKWIALRELSAGPPRELLGGLLTLRLVHNPGAAFGLASGATILFPILALGVAFYILRTARRLGSVPWAVGLGLLLGGALGNVIDRIFRPPGVLRGHVVDFLELPHWPVFNVADMAIVGAAAGMAVLSMQGRQLDGTRIVDDKPSDDHPEEPRA